MSWKKNDMNTMDMYHDGTTTTDAAAAAATDPTTTNTSSRRIIRDDGCMVGDMSSTTTTGSSIGRNRTIDLTHHHHHQQHQHQSPPSFLTVVLIQINQLLPQYFQHLCQQPVSSSTAAVACSIFDCQLIDGSICTGSSNGSSSSSSSSSKPPVTNSATQFAESAPHALISPISFQHWFQKSFSASPPTSTTATERATNYNKTNKNNTDALVLENEWETYKSPFLLLAAAELLYNGLEHLVHHDNKSVSSSTTSTSSLSSSSSLIQLYQRIDQDFNYIQLILCEPLLRSDDDPTTTIIPNNKLPSAVQQQQQSSSGPTYHRHVAMLVTQNICTLSIILSIRCQMIALQTLLIFATSNSSREQREEKLSVSSPKEQNHAMYTIIDHNNEGDDDHSISSSVLVPTYSEAAAATTIWLQTIDSTIRKVPVVVSNTTTTTTTTRSTNTTNNNTKEEKCDVNNDNVRSGECKETIVADELQLAVLPMLLSLQKELNAWKYCYETCGALELCKFLDTVIHLRNWKLYLPPKDDSTAYSKYMNKAFQRVRSLIPIYFDRTRTYANHSYGFNTSLMLQLDSNLPTGSSKEKYNEDHDHNSIVLDFLYRQDKLNGPPMVIGLVYNAISTESNLHIERGFCINNDTEPSKKTTDDVRMLLPALYLRSTMHLPTPPPPKSDAGGSGLFTSTQPSLLSTWTAGSSHGLSIPGGSPFSFTGRKQSSSVNTPTATPPLHRKSKTLSLSAAPHIPFPDAEIASANVTFTVASFVLLQNNSNALEYGPESGMVTSWPHNDWASIATLINDDKIPGKILHTTTRNNHGVSLDIQPKNACMEIVRKADSELSSIYSISIGPLLSLIVVVKDKDDDSQLLQRRKSRINSDDISTFMRSVLGPRIRISSLFSTTFVTSIIDDTPIKESKNRTSASSAVKPQLHLPTTSFANSSVPFWSNERQVQEFLNMVKLSFGLRPSTPMLRGTNTGSSSIAVWGTPRTPTEVMKHVRRRREASRAYQSNADVSETASAAMFFLGPDLASSFE